MCDRYADAFEEEGHDDLSFLLEIARAPDGEKELHGIGIACGMKPGHALKFSRKLGQVPGGAGE